MGSFFPQFFFHMEYHLTSFLCRKLSIQVLHLGIPLFQFECFDYVGAFRRAPFKWISNLVLTITELCSLVVEMGDTFSYPHRP